MKELIEASRLEGQSAMIDVYKIRTSIVATNIRFDPRILKKV